MAVPVRPPQDPLSAPKPGVLHDSAKGSTRLGAPDIVEQEQRATWGRLQRLRPAYAHLIDLAEPGRGPGHAGSMVDRIQAVIDVGGWTNSERTALYVARAKWRRRAEGKDRRYQLTNGHVRGFLRPSVQEGVKILEVADGALAVIQDELRRVRRGDRGTDDDQ